MRHEATFTATEFGPTEDPKSRFRVRQVHGFGDHADDTVQDVIYLIRGLEVRHQAARRGQR